MGVQERSIKPLEAVVFGIITQDVDTSNALTEEERHLMKRKAELRRKAFADNTWAGYKSDLLSFIRYAGTDLPFPVSSLMIENYLTIKSETLAPSTLRHHAAALSFVHRFIGAEDPTTSPVVQQILSGARKEKLDAGWQAKQAKALTADQFKQIIMAIEDDMRGLRDRTLFLVGLVCAFRQNELSKLQIEDLKKTDGKGYSYKVGRTKTDQEGTKKRYKMIPYGEGQMCPVKAIDELLAEIGDDAGPLFRGISRSGNFMLSKSTDGSSSTKGMSHTAVNAVIRKRINLAGIIDECDKDKHKALLMGYSFHSLRSTFITILRSCGVPDSKIMKQTHHTNINIIEMYDRPEMHFKDSAAGDLIAVLSE